MRTINISISESDFDQLGLDSTEYTYEQWRDLINRRMAQKRLDRSIELAEKYGLSKMEMDEITAEVKAVRNEAKNRN